MKYTLCDQCLNRITEYDLDDAVKVDIHVFCSVACRDLWVEEKTYPLNEYDLIDYTS